MNDPFINILARCLSYHQHGAVIRSHSSMHLTYFSSIPGRMWNCLRLFCIQIALVESWIKNLPTDQSHIYVHKMCKWV